MESNNANNLHLKIDFKSFVEESPDIIRSHFDSDFSREVFEGEDGEPKPIFLEFEKIHHKTGEQITLKHLLLHEFKRHECPKRGCPHNHKSCFYFHSIKD